LISNVSTGGLHDTCDASKTTHFNLSQINGHSAVARMGLWQKHCDSVWRLRLPFGSCEV